MQVLSYKNNGWPNDCAFPETLGRIFFVSADGTDRVILNGSSTALSITEEVNTKYGYTAIHSGITCKRLQVSAYEIKEKEAMV